MEAKYKNTLIYVGIVQFAHGIKGNILVKSLTKPLDNILGYSLYDVYENPIDLKFISFKDDKLICNINKTTNRNDAEKLKKMKLFCKREELPKIDEEEFYVTDLIGLKIIDTNFYNIGFVSDAHNYGAGDILEITINNESEKNDNVIGKDKKLKKKLLPFTKLYFPKINDDHIILNEKIIDIF